MLPSASYLWFKGLHLAFMVTWFAGLFYLPRLFVYHAEAADQAIRDRFSIMEMRLFAIMTIGAIATAIFGLVMLWMNPALLGETWFKVKLALVAGLVAYHLACKRWIHKLKTLSTPRATRGLRWFNEIPGAFLLAIVLLAVLKPA